MKRFSPYIVVFLLLCLFLAIKIPHLSIRFSDTNVYFYEGYKILHGAKIYKDILFTNLPMWGYVSAAYVFLTGGSLTSFFFISKLEVCITALFLFLIAKKKTENSWAQITAPAVYLFSTAMLATSEHQTGVFFAILGAVASYYFSLIKRPILSGICAAIGFTTKAYTLPLLAALGIHYLIFERKLIVKFIAGFTATFAAIVGPSLIIAPQEMYKQLIGYSLVRQAGVSKENVFMFFILNDPLIFILGIYSLSLVKKYTYVLLSIVFSLVFLLAYTDVYYLYLTMFVPAAALAAAALITDLSMYKKHAATAAMVIVAAVASFNIYHYTITFSQLGTIPNLKKLVTTIQQHKPDQLYGADSITPALAYLSGVPLHNNMIDTNLNFYNAGIYSAFDQTKLALTKKTIFVSPAFSGQLTSGIIDSDVIQGRCKKLESVPFLSEGGDDSIVLLKCF